MALWCFTRLKAMLADIAKLAEVDNVTVEELGMISGKYGGAENMFEMVRANPTVLYQFWDECQSVRNLFQFAKAIHLPENDLKDLIEHHGVFNLLELLEGYGWSSLTYLRTMLKNREECPVKVASEATPADGDCMINGLVDGALHNPLLEGSKKKFLGSFGDPNARRQTFG